MIPLTIDYLDTTRYGIWITLSSIIGWFGFFDIGLGHGLRNRFAEALALGKHEEAKEYVSTTYAILFIIISCIIFLFYVVNPYINWNIILNASKDTVAQKELSLLALVIFTFFCLQFVFKLIATILIADQRPAIASSLDLLGKVLSLILVVFFLKTTDSSLIYLGFAMSVSPVLVLILANCWFFRGRYNIYKPSIKSVAFSKAGILFNLGIKFFIVQIEAIILYQTNNIIIAQLFGPEQVTPYNVAFKYFSVLLMAYTIIISPFWSAFTDAWAKQDIQWIRQIIRRLVRLWVGLFLSGLVMLACSSWIYAVWVGDKVYVSYTMSMLIMTWVLVKAWNGIFVQFLNGVGKISLQLVIGFCAAIINIPLSIYLGKLIGIEGIFVANILLSLVTILIYPVQYKKLLNGTAVGIYNK